MLWAGHDVAHVVFLKQRKYISSFSGQEHISVVYVCWCYDTFHLFDRNTVNITIGEQRCYKPLDIP